MELRAFFSSLLFQTFTFYGLAYWRFLLRGLLLRPSMVAETVTMAIKGHHFFQITRRILAVENFKGRLESVARAFHERAQGKLSPDLEVRLVELRRYRDECLAELKRRYRTLHRDFRVYADEALARFQADTDELLARLSAQAPILT